MKKDVYLIYEDSKGGYFKVIYRNKSLFTQKLQGKKENYFNVSLAESKNILKNKNIFVSNKKFVSYGIGWDVA